MMPCRKQPRETPLAASTIAAMMFGYRGDRRRGSDVVHARGVLRAKIPHSPAFRDTLTAFALRSMIRR